MRSFRHAKLCKPTVVELAHISYGQELGLTRGGEGGDFPARAIDAGHRKQRDEGC